MHGRKPQSEQLNAQAIQEARDYCQGAKGDESGDSISFKLVKYLLAFMRSQYPHDNASKHAKPGWFNGNKDVKKLIARKRAISAYVDTAIEQGVEQIVVIGGGLDVLAQIKQMHYPRVHFYEVDAKGQQQAKCFALRMLSNGIMAPGCAADDVIAIKEYAHINPTMHYVSANMLAANWFNVLTKEGFDPAKQTVCIVDGLRLYARETAIPLLIARAIEGVPNHQIEFVPTGPNKNYNNGAKNAKTITPC